MLDDERLYGPAVLLREEGARMVRELALIIGLEPTPASTDESGPTQLAGRPATSGYRLRANADLQARAEYMSCVVALAEHLGCPAGVLIRPS